MNITKKQLLLLASASAVAILAMILIDSRSQSNSNAYVEAAYASEYHTKNEQSTGGTKVSGRRYDSMHDDDIPLAARIDELRSRSANASKIDACTLSWSMQTCISFRDVVGDEEVEKELLLNPSDTAIETAILTMDANEKIGRMCKGIGFSIDAESEAALLRTARLGHVRSMTAYALLKINNEISETSDVLFAKKSEMDTVIIMLNRAANAGDPEAIYETYRLYSDDEKIAAEDKTFSLATDKVKAHAALNSLLPRFEAELRAQTAAGIEDQFATFDLEQRRRFQLLSSNYTYALNRFAGYDGIRPPLDKLLPSEACSESWLSN
jgi:hypothetical protein